MSTELEHSMLSLSVATYLLSSITFHLLLVESSFFSFHILQLECYMPL